MATCKQMHPGGRCNILDTGLGYLHGNSITSSKNREGYLHGNSITSSKNGNCAGTTEFKIRDQTEVAMASKWKPKENGAIPCPPKDMGGCSKGTLNLRCIFSENWMSQLLLKAKEIAHKCELKETIMIQNLHYSRSKYKVTMILLVALRKATARENSDDNYVFCPAAVDTGKLYLSEGEPVVATNVHDNALRSSWEPMVVWRACRKTETDTDVLNCLNWCKPEVEHHHQVYLMQGYHAMASYFEPGGRLLWFFHGAGRRPVTKLGHAVTDTVRLSPSDGTAVKATITVDLDTNISMHFNLWGHSDEIALRNLQKPYKSSLSRSYVCFRSTLMHTQAVVPTVEQLSAIENLKQIHKAQDQREFVADANRMHESINDCILNVNGKSFLKGLNCDGLKVENSSKAENKYSQQSVKKAACETKREKNTNTEKIVVLILDRIGLNNLKKQMMVLYGMSLGGKMFLNCRNISRSTSGNLGTYMAPVLPQVVHPIFDETFYLSTEHKRRLKEEYGEAVFAPADALIKSEI
ncbi:hypothetical protein HAX54_043506 [Datura stramonium]|uniref:Uncharacterized protein n=1 Tax=Datura stramonium TaxID=4076 RepID=A0ABS8SNH1_DATST|nr:hypothetical protein [Datura stramonium]